MSRCSSSILEQLPCLTPFNGIIERILRFKGVSEIGLVQINYGKYQILPQTANTHNT